MIYCLSFLLLRKPMNCLFRRLVSNPHDILIYLSWECALYVMISSKTAVKARIAEASSFHMPAVAGNTGRATRPSYQQQIRASRNHQFSITSPKAPKQPCPHASQPSDPPENDSIATQTRSQGHGNIRLLAPTLHSRPRTRRASSTTAPKPAECVCARRVCGTFGRRVQ